MSREILFKAKCKTEKWVWAEGYLVEQNYPDYHAYIFQNINIDKGNNYTDIISHDIIEIDPKTVCQYTGLTDKYGRKIFEGDILSGQRYRDWGQGGEYIPDKCIIKWNNKRAAFDPIYWWDSNHDLKDYEVIGNIFDNPELVEE